VAKRYPHGEGSVKWVSTEWLEAHLEDEGLQILDCQPDIHDYISEHLPGAIYFSEGSLRATFGGLPGAWVPPEAVQPVLRRLGLRRGAPAVVYTGVGPFKGRGDGLEQTIVAYSLARYGHEQVYVLDGGVDKWKAEGRALTRVFPKVEESDFTIQVQRDYFVEYREFKSIKDREDVLLLDARPPALYEGQGPWIKPGHIPGAVNLPWASLMDDHNKSLLKPDEEIQAILDIKDIRAEKTIICSCGTGREATDEFLLFKWYLGYPQVKLHEGAFTEWTSYPDNPTVTGSSPR